MAKSIELKKRSNKTFSKQGYLEKEDETENQN